MLRSLNPPPDPHQDHVKRLLDQRSARVDLHTRFPPDPVDTPSVYNHAFFSPRQQNNMGQDSNVISHNYEMLSASYAPEPRSPMFDRERINDPTASVLDLDDNSRSYEPSEADRHDQELTEDDSESLRMSLLGPKMRFHSRAPWEIEEQDLDQGDESDNSANYITAPKRGRIRSYKGEIIKKGLGFGSTSSATRPSGDSSRPQAKPKRSFDTASSISQRSNLRGALHSTEASISSTSLVSLPSPTLPRRFSLGRIRSMTPSSSNHPSPRVSPHSSVRPDYSTGSPRVRASTDTHTSTARGSFSSSEKDNDFHPYAHPDLAVPYAIEPPRSSSLRATLMYPISSSDSSTTITNSPTTSSLSRSGTVTTMTPDTSVSSVREQSPRNHTSYFQGKTISSPLPSHTTPRSSDVSKRSGDRENKLLPSHPGRTGVAGWSERPKSPTFTLISLEEARAQRSQSITVHRDATQDSGSTPVPFPVPAQEIAGTSSHNNSPSFSMSRARARSVSAGAKAKHALQSIVGGPSPSDRRESEAGLAEQHALNGGMSGKVLKHKKSGFMRLFNGKEQKERDKEQPPPVPQLSNSYFNNQPPVQKPFKITTHRIPVPQLSPSPTEEPSTTYGASNSSSDNQGHPSEQHKISLSQKRPFPPLSINISPQVQASRTPVSATAVDQTFLSVMAPPSMSDVDSGRVPSQSAPPDVQDFPALKLRPVSTLFSAHFRDHIVRQESPQFDQELDTLSSTSPTATSPLTPGCFARTDGPYDEVADDQSSVIQGLQDQILSAKRAWQQNIWDLEGQVRDLKAEVEDLRAAGNDRSSCEVCGRGKQSWLAETEHHRDGMRNNSVVNRPRARTGIAARFGSGN